MGSRTNLKRASRTIKCFQGTRKAHLSPQILLGSTRAACNPMQPCWENLVCQCLCTWMMTFQWEPAWKGMKLAAVSAEEREDSTTSRTLTRWSRGSRTAPTSSRRGRWATYTLTHLVASSLESTIKTVELSQTSTWTELRCQERTPSTLRVSLRTSIKSKYQLTRARKIIRLCLQAKSSLKDW